MAARITKTLCLLLLELTQVITGVSIYSEDCFADKYCFSLILNRGDGEYNLTDAQNRCGNIRSKLAEISDSQIQSYAAEFLKNASTFINVLTQRSILINAQRYDNESWSWVNGKALETNITVNGSQHMTRIWTSYNSSGIESASPTEKSGYICEIQNATHPPHNYTFNHTGRCFVVNNSPEDWFGARNKCLLDGDLASLDWLANTSDLLSLSSSAWLSKSVKYWIGLRKSRWIWEGSKTEVKYTSWKNDSQQFDSAKGCISLNYSSTPIGQWMPSDCNSTSPIHYLCLREKRSKTMASTPIAPMDNTARANSATSTNTVALGLGVGLGIFVALLIIVIVILVVIIVRRRRRPLTINNTSSQTSPSSANKANAKPRNGIPYYTQVEKHKSEDGGTAGDDSTAATSAESVTASEPQSSYAEVMRDHTASSPAAFEDLPEPVYINADIIHVNNNFDSQD